MTSRPSGRPGSEGARVRFVVDPRPLVRALATAAVVVGVVGLLLRILALDPQVAAALGRGEPAAFTGYPLLLPLFDVDAEGNLPTWLSAAVLLLSALVCWGIGAERRAEADPWWRHWGLLAAAFGYLSVDELSQLHELGVPLAALVVEPRGVLTFAWVVIAAPLVLAFGLTFLGFVRALPSPVRTAVVLAGVLYVGGALGLELVGGWYADSPTGERSLPYVVVSSAEEALEIAGALLFLRALTLVPRAPSAAAPSPLGSGSTR